MNITELVVRTEGKVLESNVNEFRESALAFIDGIKTELVTDQDFADALKNVEKLSTCEGKLLATREGIISQNADIAKAIAVVDEIYEVVRKTRLGLSKAGKDEKLARKSEVEFEGLEKLIVIYKASILAKHLGAPDPQLVKGATKGRSSLDSMRKEVNRVIECEQKRVQELETLYTDNLEMINKAGNNALFPDKEQLAVKPSGEVVAVIESRVAKYELEQKEKKEREEKDKREKEEAKKRAEVKRIEREEQKKIDDAKKLEEEAAKAVSFKEDAQQVQEIEPEVLPIVEPVHDCAQDLAPWDTAPESEVAPKVQYVITAVTNDEDFAIKIAKGLDNTEGLYDVGLKTL